MIDTHAHVHDPAFDLDREAMPARARERGVDAIVTVGCDVEDSRRACETAERYGLWATVGIHPHEAKDAPHDLAAAFDALRARYGERVVAVGETGLDYHYDHSPREAQRAVFATQLAYARERDLPLVFHQREAHADFVAGLRASYDPRSLRGISGVVTFKTAQPLRDAVTEVGLASIVLETDCPYLAPIPHRGKRNEPAYVADTARVVAGVLGVDVETVIARADANARRVLGLKVIA